MPRTPDRLDILAVCVVEYISRKFDRNGKLRERGRMLCEREVARVLRAEHAWMRRIVTQLPLYGATATEFKAGYTQACQDILGKLTQ